MVDRYAMAARMCMQNFVALCCVLRKPRGLCRTDKDNKNNQSSILGPAFRVQKILKLLRNYKKHDKMQADYQLFHLPIKILNVKTYQFTTQCKSDQFTHPK